MIAIFKPVGHSVYRGELGGIAMVRLDHSGRILDSSPAARELLRGRGLEFAGQPKLPVLLGRRSFSILRHRIVAALDAEETPPFILEMPSGFRVEVRLRAEPVQAGAAA